MGSLRSGSTIVTVPICTLITIDEDTVGKVTSIGSTGKLIIAERRRHLTGRCNKLRADNILGNSQRLSNLCTQGIVILHQNITVANISKSLNQLLGLIVRNILEIPFTGTLVDFLIESCSPETQFHFLTSVCTRIARCCSHITLTIVT